MAKQIDRDTFAAAKEERDKLARNLAKLDRALGLVGGTSRDYQQRRKREEASASKEVLIPAPKDMARRLEMESNVETWLRFYLQELFAHPFQPHHKQMIDAIMHAAKYGGDQAIAAPRGEGKTSVCECVAMYCVLTGVVRFPVIFAATGTDAERSLKTICDHLTNNPLLQDDYPEVCKPITALESTAQRARTMLATGVDQSTGEEYFRIPIDFKWTGREVSFPSVPGSKAGGARIATRGLDAAVRGLKIGNLRPDLAIIDDPDTEETVNNQEQGAKLEKRIDRAIAGLGTWKRGIARVMLTTIQNRECVSFRYTDAKEKPSWHGKRYRFMIVPPTRSDLWDEYIQLLQQDQQQGDIHGRRAHAFYLENREAMDAGAKVANPYRFNDEVLPDGTQIEVSACQRYYNEVAKIGLDSVASEYDCDPPARDAEHARLILTAYHIQHGCLSGLDRRILPDDIQLLTIGADVQKKGLHWVAIAWSDNAAGCIVDYDFFEFGTEGRDVADCELAILEGLWSWHTVLEEHPYLSQSGEIHPVDLALIDTGWKDESWASQPVQVFCNALGNRQFMPSKGQSPYRAPKESRDTKVGEHWHCTYPNPFIAMNSDHWKLKVHEGFLQEQGTPGALSLFNLPMRDGRVDRNKHLSFAKHILAESWETKLTPGFKRHETRWWHYGKANHYFDATYQAVVARSVRGLRAISAADVPSQPRPVVAAPPRVDVGARHHLPSKRRINFRRRA